LICFLIFVLLFFIFLFSYLVNSATKRFQKWAARPGSAHGGGGMAVAAHGRGWLKWQVWRRR
jgi:hypothetical protein